LVLVQTQGSSAGWAAVIPDSPKHITCLPYYHFTISSPSFSLPLTFPFSTPTFSQVNKLPLVTFFLVCPSFAASLSKFDICLVPDGFVTGD